MGISDEQIKTLVQITRALENALDTKARYVRDPEYWGVPYGTLITPGMKPIGQMRLPDMPTPRATVRASIDSERAERREESLVGFAREEARSIETLLRRARIDPDMEGQTTGFRNVLDELDSRYGVSGSGVSTESGGVSHPLAAGGDWALFGACRDIRQAAYGILGYDEEDTSADPHLQSGGDPGYGQPDSGAKAPYGYAYKLMQDINEAPRTKIPLWRGVDLTHMGTPGPLRFIDELKRDDTFDLPVASFSGNRKSALRFGNSVLFRVVVGAKAIQGGWMGAEEDDSFDEDIFIDDLFRESTKMGADYNYEVTPENSEMLTGGRFKVVSIKKDSEGDFVVSIRQLATFDPESGLATKAANRRWKWAYLFDDSLLAGTKNNETKTRRVRTPAGQARFKQPIGSIIVADAIPQFQPRVTRRADDIVGNPSSTLGTTITEVAKPGPAGQIGGVPETELLYGSPIGRYDLPEISYHVSTNVNAVLRSGFLQASSGGGLGGSHKDSVSITVDREVAEQLVNDMRMYASLVTSNASPEVVVSRLRIEFDRLEMTGFSEIERTASVYSSEEASWGSALDSLTSLFFNIRSNQGKGRNPIILGGAWSEDSPWKNINPLDIGIVEVPRSSIPESALVLNYDIGQSRGLEEARVYADIPLPGPRADTPSSGSTLGASVSRLPNITKEEIDLGLVKMAKGFDTFESFSTAYSLEGIRPRSWHISEPGFTLDPSRRPMDRTGAESQDEKLFTTIDPYIWQDYAKGRDLVVEYDLTNLTFGSSGSNGSEDFYSDQSGNEGLIVNARSYGKLREVGRLTMEEANRRADEQQRLIPRNKEELLILWDIAHPVSDKRVREVNATDNESAWEAVLTDEARAIANRQRAHPERYNPPGNLEYGLKDGAVELRVVRNGSGPPRVQEYETNTSAGLTNIEASRVPGFLGIAVSGYGKPLVPVGDARPPQHVYRVVSTAEFDAAQAQGFFQTDGRMNLGRDEGTVTSLRSTGNFYVPTDGSDYRVVRIRYDDSDGWWSDTDSYIKTPERVPFERVDLYTSPVSQSGVVNAKVASTTRLSRYGEIAVRLIVASPSSENMSLSEPFHLFDIDISKDMKVSDPWDAQPREITRPDPSIADSEFGEITGESNSFEKAMEWASKNQSPPTAKVRVNDQLVRRILDHAEANPVFKQWLRDSLDLPGETYAALRKLYEMPQATQDTIYENLGISESDRATIKSLYEQLERNLFNGTPDLLAPDFTTFDSSFWETNLSRLPSNVQEGLGKLRYLGVAYSGRDKDDESKMLIQSRDLVYLSEIAPNFSIEQTAAAYYTRITIDQWAETSGDSSAESIALQTIVEDIFSLDGKATTDHMGSMYSSRVFRDTNGPFLEVFVRAVYENTQDFFKANGITHIDVFRGMKWFDAEKIPAWAVRQPSEQELAGADYLSLVTAIDDIATGKGTRHSGLILTELNRNYKPESVTVTSQPVSSWSTDESAARVFGKPVVDTSYGMVVSGRIPVERILSTAVTGFGCLEESEVTLIGNEDTLKVERRYA